MAQSWYDFPVTQGHGVNGEDGIDLGTPFHTPITALYAGTCTWAGRTQWSCGSSGGEVVITCNVPDAPQPGIYSSYYLHLDSVSVHQGDKVNAGQLIGLSGGQLSGGQWPVVNCPQKGDIYSTGVHTEFGFNAPWVSGPGHNIDPTFAINAARKGTLPATTPGGSFATLSDAQASGTGSPIQPYQLQEPVFTDAVQLRLAEISSNTHKIAFEPAGFDGICEAIQSVEASPNWNWANPVGSFFASIKPWTVRFFFIIVAMMACIFIVWQWVKGPTEHLIGIAGAVAAPEAAGAMSASDGLAEAPESVAR